MLDALRDAVLRLPGASPRPDGIVPTASPGLALVRRSSPGRIERTGSRPYVCVVLQGAKDVAMGTGTRHYRRGDTMVIPANLPTVTRTTEASHSAPYLAVAIAVDFSVVLGIESKTSRDARWRPGRTNAELQDALCRLIRLLDRPDSLAVLRPGLLLEIHHWLLAGVHGDELRHLSLPDGRARRIAKAVALLRADYSKPISIDQLAAAATMGRAAFHRHFRAITSMSPLQYQKKIRLTEARRLIFDGVPPGRASAEVGYASVTQFTREYSRAFGSPPVRDRQSRMVGS